MFLLESNRKSYALYQMVTLPLSASDVVCVRVFANSARVYRSKPSQNFAHEGRQ